jgi:hypothetical protein
VQTPACLHHRVAKLKRKRRRRRRSILRRPPDACLPVCQVFCCKALANMAYDDVSCQVGILYMTLLRPAYVKKCRVRVPHRVQTTRRVVLKSHLIALPRAHHHPVT